MESDLLKKLAEFPSPFFWGLDESMYENVREKVTQWACSEADRLACRNVLAFLRYAQDDDSLEARRQFQHVLDEDPEDLVALTSLAYLDVKCSSVADAEEKHKTLLNLKESGSEHDIRKRRASAMFEKAFCLTRFGQRRYREAQACIEAALRFDGGNKEWLKAETFLLTKLAENKPSLRARQDETSAFLERAATNVLKLQQMEPGSGEVVCMKAEVFYAAGNTPKGKAWMKDYQRRHPDQILDLSALYEEAYKLSPRDQHVCRKAALHLRVAGELQKAEEILSNSVTIFPKDYFLFHQYGLLYFDPFQRTEAKGAKSKAKNAAEASDEVKEKSTTLPRAEEYFQKGVAFDPHFTTCRICLAQCLYYQGKVAESNEQFRIAVEKARQSWNIIQARREWAKLLIEEGNEWGALMQLREALKFEGQVERSVYQGLDFALGRLCKLDERDPIPVRVRAALALEAGREDEAIEYYTQALEIDNEDTSSLIGLGKAHKKKGKTHFEEARQWFEKASHLGSDKADDELVELMEMMEVEDERGATGPSSQIVD